MSSRVKECLCAVLLGFAALVPSACAAAAEAPAAANAPVRAGGSGTPASGEAEDAGAEAVPGPELPAKLAEDAFWRSVLERAAAAAKEKRLRLKGEVVEETGNRLRDVKLTLDLTDAGGETETKYLTLADGTFDLDRKGCVMAEFFVYADGYYGERFTLEPTSPQTIRAALGRPAPGRRAAAGRVGGQRSG